MLEIRPNCEFCDRDLEPSSTDAYICSYECTFCHSCVENRLKNVCPNCGGGFTQRPIRPSIEHRKGLSIVRQSPSIKRIHTKYSDAEITSFIAPLLGVKPEQR